VTTIGRKDAVGFQSARFRPEGSTLIVAGDLQLDAALRIAERMLGDWEGAATPPAPPEVRGRGEAGAVYLVDRPAAVQSELRMGHLGVARTHPDFFPLLVMNAVLGGTFASRLNLNLRERHGYTYGVNSGWTMRRQPGFFSVSTAVQTERTAAAAAEVLKEIERLRSEPVAAAELDDARSYLAGVFPLRAQTTQGLASRLATLAAYELPLDYFVGYRDRVLAVTGAEVLRAAREHLHPERLAIVAAGDAASLRGDMEQLGHGPVLPSPLAGTA
jgi:zinc protease